MKGISLKVGGKTYMIVTRDGKTEVGVNGNTTSEYDDREHVIEVPNIMIITRKNADVLFVLQGGKNDSFKIITAQELYDKFKYQWFEPLADNYRELLYVNSEKYVIDAYKILTWADIVNFSLVDRPSYSYYKNMEGDWKKNAQGGAGYLLVLISNIPYWTDAIGQIPFAIDTYRNTKSIIETVKIGIEWGAGTLTGKVDYSNEYDNYFVLRGAIYASKNFYYENKSSGKLYPAIVSVEKSNSVNPSILGEPISNDELKKYGAWKI